MDRLRRNLLSAIAFSPLLARAQQPGDASFTTLRRELPLETQGKIEVVEFFWYGCIHCFRLEALLEAWLPKLRPDTVFRRIPAVFNERWGHDAAIYYAFEALGVLDRLHRPLFDAIHLNRLRTDNPKALAEWLQRSGLEPSKFDATMKSFGVQSKVKRAAQITAAAGIDGTPALAVQGRYTISAEQGGSHAGMLATADRLIGVVRKTLAAKK
ncbi:MAG: thiol:disulfide interchange protein DsbA/DsbL [Betaproteobacteria bacterium]|nr:thiol:disulfide interchange protein DsbA/DsbL [Betaproteobacteria bacterium]